MYGLIFALLFAGFHYFILKQPVTEFYAGSVSVLWYWYIFCAVIMGLIFIVVSFLLALGLPLKGLEKLGPIGAVLGVAGSGVILLLMWGWYIVKYGALLYGTYLLSLAWNGEVWNQNMLIIGGVLLLVGILLGGSASSSSKSNSSSSTSTYTVRRSSPLVSRPSRPSWTSAEYQPRRSLSSGTHRCPNCGTGKIPDTMGNCPQCGAPQPDEK